MQCEAWRDAMLEVLYGEADGATARRVEDHQRQCAACREEMASFRKLRKDLAAWTLPVTGRLREPVGRPWYRRGWAVAAAILLAMTGGLVLAGAELRFERGALLVRVGPGTRAEEVQSLLDEQEARHRRAIESLRAPVTDPRRDETALLDRVAEMIRESEARQAGRVELRLAEFGERAENQRRLDLAQIRAGLAYLDGKHVARATEMMGYVLQASQKR
jgi:hypothetical protein